MLLVISAIEMTTANLDLVIWVRNDVTKLEEDSQHLVLAIAKRPLSHQVVMRIMTVHLPDAICIRILDGLC